MRILSGASVKKQEEISIFSFLEGEEIKTFGKNIHACEHSAANFYFYSSILKF